LIIVMVYFSSMSFNYKISKSNDDVKYIYEIQSYD